MSYEYYSNVTLVASVVVYVLAMSAFAGEWAAARKVAPVAAEERELAGVGGRAAAGPDARDSTAGDRNALDPAALDPNALDSSALDPTKDVRVDRWGRIGLALTGVAFVLSLAGVVLRGLAAGRAPWGNMFEFTITAMAFVVAVFLVGAWKFGWRWLGLPVTLLAAIGNGLAVTVFYVAVAPLVPALHSVWFIIHIVAAAIAGAAFNIGGLLSILYLVRRRAEERDRVSGSLRLIPTAARLDVLAYRFSAFAFPLWTFALAAGAIWAEYAWGRYWGWDPKETWTLVTWVIYACYLHARATAGWRGKRAAVIAIVGVASFWFNFVGINLLVSGLHSYAGV